MKGTLITVGIILLAVGIVGLIFQYYVTWMWVLAVVGVVGIIWGLMAKKDQAVM